MESNKAGGGREHGVQSRGHFYLGLKAGWITRELQNFYLVILKPPEIKAKVSLPRSPKHTWLFLIHSKWSQAHTIVGTNCFGQEECDQPLDLTRVGSILREGGGPHGQRKEEWWMLGQIMWKDAERQWLSCVHYRWHEPRFQGIREQKGIRMYAAAWKTGHENKGKT